MSVIHFVLKPTVGLSLVGTFGGATIAPPIKLANTCGGIPIELLCFMAIMTFANSSSEMFNVILSSLLMLFSVYDFGYFGDLCKAHSPLCFQY